MGTRNKIWSEIQKQLPRRRAQVFEAIAEWGGKAALFEICELIRLPAHQVSGRITELRKAGLIKEVDRKKSPYSGATVVVWGICAEVEQ